MYTYITSPFGQCNYTHLIYNENRRSNIKIIYDIEKDLPCSFYLEIEVDEKKWMS